MLNISSRDMLDPSRDKKGLLKICSWSSKYLEAQITEGHHLSASHMNSPQNLLFINFFVSFNLPFTVFIASSTSSSRWFRQSIPVHVGLLQIWKLYINWYNLQSSIITKILLQASWLCTNLILFCWEFSFNWSISAIFSSNLVFRLYLFITFAFVNFLLINRYPLILSIEKITFLNYLEI